MKECGKPLISIIVPVYQVKDYVGDCVESLCRQTYTNLEIVLVDDGSTDGSEVICDDYARRDNRIRVIHQENQGLSAARNAGLDQATGEYVAFVDSDDVVLPSYIEELYRLIKKYHADIAACAYARGEMEKIKYSDPEKRKCTVDVDGRDIKVCDSGSTSNDIGRNIGVRGSDTGGNVTDRSIRVICMTSEQMLRQWHGRYKKWETIACNKLYRRQILDEINGAAVIRFPIGRRHEDVLTSHLIVAKSDRIVLTTQELYLYRNRENSITTQIMTAENRQQNLRAQRERMAFFRKRRYWRAYLNLLVGYVLHLGWFGWRRVREHR